MRGTTNKPNAWHILVFLLCVITQSLVQTEAFQRPTSLHPTLGVSAGSSVGRREILPFAKVQPSRGSALLEIINGDSGTTHQKSLLQHAGLVAGVASALSWIALAIVALRYHPDPKFAHCSTKHNVLTMSQAFAFPLPLLLGAVGTVYQNESDPDATRRLQLGLAATFAYLFASTVWAPAFACGYDLYPSPLKTVAGSVFGFASLVHWALWKRNPGSGIASAIRGTNEALWSMAPSADQGSALFASCTVGFLWFALQPLVCEYPLMTIPTILGKRLSRPAGAFTFLGAVASFCLSRRSKPALLLRRGLGIGSALHLLLVALKLVGVDDGGFLLPGRGLWEVYPAMMAVPFATTMSLLVHGLAVMGAFL